MSSFWFTVFCVASNGLASLAIIFLNKMIYRNYNFPNMTMTCLHFFITTIGLRLCSALRLFQPKTLPLSRMLPISLTFCGFVVFTNLSLQNNTVGTYQIVKTMTIPGVVFIQTFFYQRSFSAKIKLTLIPIILGVVLNSYFDISFNLAGVIYGALGVLVTSLYQVWVAEEQQALGVTSTQLLYYQAPLSALVIFIILPLFEPLTSQGGLFSPWPREVKLLVVATGMVAFVVNLSIFWIIGNTSPLTYNVAGQFKFCLTLLGGFILFQDPVHVYQVYCGIGLTVIGVFAYTYFKLEERQASVMVKELPYRQVDLELVDKSVQIHKPTMK